jgi:hypothetical protein
MRFKRRLVIYKLTGYKGGKNMGTINYGSNDVIDLGVDISKEGDFGILSEVVSYIYDDVKNILDNYNFYYYHVAIKEGYYSGFYLDIEPNFYIYDSYLDKIDAQKELTQLKKFLLECAGVGLVVYLPGWVTGYYDFIDTKNAIKEAIKNARLVVKTAPTDYTYKEY